MNLAGGDAWTDLGDGILVRQSRAFAMNSVVLASPQHTVLMDPGVLPSELDDIAGLVREAEPKETTLFFTHAHWDHVLGRPWWPKAKTLAHDRLAAELRRERSGIVEDAENLAKEHGERWTQRFEPFAPDVAVSGLRFMRFDPWRIVFRDAPGHSPTQLTAHLTDQAILIAADMLSDLEPPILDGPCRPFIETLEALRLLAENGAIETLVPGHGRIAHGRAAVLARFRTDLDYLGALDRGVRAAVAKGLTLEATQQGLAAMDYTARDSAPDWVQPFHMENIRFAYEGTNPARR